MPSAEREQCRAELSEAVLSLFTFSLMKPSSWASYPRGDLQGVSQAYRKGRVVPPAHHGRSSIRRRRGVGTGARGVRGDFSNGEESAAGNQCLLSLLLCFCARSAWQVPKW